MLHQTRKRWEKYLQGGHVICTNYRPSPTKIPKEGTLYKIAPATSSLNWTKSINQIYEQNWPTSWWQKCCPQNLVQDALCALGNLVPFGNQAQITKNQATIFVPVLLFGCHQLPLFSHWGVGEQRTQLICSCVWTQLATSEVLQVQSICFSTRNKKKQQHTKVYQTWNEVNHWLLWLGSQIFTACTSHSKFSQCGLCPVLKYLNMAPHTQYIPHCLTPISSKTTDRCRNAGLCFDTQCRVIMKCNCRKHSCIKCRNEMKTVFNSVVLKSVSHQAPINNVLPPFTTSVANLWNVCGVVSFHSAH